MRPLEQRERRGESGGQSISSAEDGGDPSANIDSVFYGAAEAAVGGVQTISDDPISF